MMDKVITDGNTALVFPFSGSGHDKTAKQYDFYDNMFHLLGVTEYSYYGEARCLPEACAAPEPLCCYCVPGVWINGNVNPCLEYNVPFYGDDIVFPELLAPCLDTGMMLPPRFHHLANTGPDIVYDYDFPCVAVDGQLCNSIHMQPVFDTMQIEDELYAKRYSNGLAVYTALHAGNFLPLVRNKVQNGVTHICVFMTEPPRDPEMPIFDMGDGYYLLFFTENMVQDEKGYVIPGIGLGEINIKATHIVHKGEGFAFK